MTSTTLLLLSILVPCIGGLTLTLVGRMPNLREAVTLVTAVALFLLVLQITETVDE